MVFTVKMLLIAVLSLTLLPHICDSVPLVQTVSPTNVPTGSSSSTVTGSGTNSNPTPAVNVTAGRTLRPGFAGHKLLRIQAQPKEEYLPNNGTLMITGDSTMRVFDFHEIVNPKFDPSSFLKQATRESTQKIEVPLNYGQHYFIFLPPALVKEYHLFRSRSGRRRVKRHHPSMLQSVLRQLQNYALVPIQSNNAKVRYVLLKNPKFVISGVGPSGAPISATIPVTQQPGSSLSIVQPPKSHHSIVQPPTLHHAGPKLNSPTIQSGPVPNSQLMPQIMDILSPMTIAPPPKQARPTSRPWTPSRSRSPPLTRNNRPRSATTVKKAILGERIDGPVPVPEAGPIDSLFNENIAPAPVPAPAPAPAPQAPVQFIQTGHVHSHARGHVQSMHRVPGPSSNGRGWRPMHVQKIHTGLNSRPRVDMVSQNVQSAGQSASISASVHTASSSSTGHGGAPNHRGGAAINDIDHGIHATEPSVNHAPSGVVNTTSSIDTAGTHTVHQTEIVETVIETKNQQAAVAKTDTAAVTANQTASVATAGGVGGAASIASQSSVSSAAAATSAVAAKQEKVVSTKKTTKTTKIKHGTDASGKPAAVHEVTEVVEHTSAAKTDASTATKTDTAATSSSAGTVVSGNGGASGVSKVDTASAAAAASSASSVTSNNATTTVKKKTIKKTIVTKTASGSAVGNITSTKPASSIAPPVDAPVLSETSEPSTRVPDSITVTAMDSNMPAVKRQRKNKKKAKTAILSENNDRKSVGIQAALIATPKPKMAAKIVGKTTETPASSTVTMTPEPPEDVITTTSATTTEEVEMEDILTTTMSPTTVLYDYTVPITTSVPRVAGWGGGPTTDPALGPMDRINTTDVPEEIEARPDKTPAELRREMIKLNPNLPKNSPKLGPQPVKKGKPKPGVRRPSRQRQGPPSGSRAANRKRAQKRQQAFNRRRKGRGRQRNGRKNSRNNPRLESSERRSGPRPRTRDPLTRWLWNNLETPEVFENIPFWMFLK